jgi:predicted lipid carrier protein YhbT
VQRGLNPGAALTYRMDAPTFEGLIRGRQTAQRAFFNGGVEIHGDMEKALQLAMLIDQFLLERTPRPAQQMEAPHALVRL